MVYRHFGRLRSEITEINEVDEETEAGGPEEAFRWRRLAEVDENGLVSKDALTKALDQREKNAQRSASGLVQTAGLSRQRWISRGPQNVGGRTRAFLVNPQNPNMLWAGSAGGGLWRSVDAGQSWSPINDFLPNLAVSSLTIDPNNPNILYCGTGEGYFNGDALNGAGIFKSADQGATWTQLPNTTSFSTVDRISVAPGNSNLILASTSSGIRRSADGGNSWTIVRGGQRSFFVAFKPGDATKAIGQILDYDFTLGQWFQDSVYSVNGGLTWQNSNIHTTDFNARIEMAFSASNPNIVYALNGGTNAAVRKSTDGGVTFTAVSATAPSEAFQAWYDDTI
jgi:photosystem II stability/assembly factor-like uncharacterized protein